MAFWKKQEPKRIFYVSGKEVQPQNFGRLAVDVACQAFPSFMSKLDGYAENVLIQTLVREQTPHLRFHFFAFIVAPFFAFARQISKVPEEIYLRIAAGVINGLREKADTSGLQMTDEETNAFSQLIVRYASLVYSEKLGAYGPAPMLCASYILNTVTKSQPSNEQFSDAELVLLPLLLDAEMHECLDAMERLNLRYEELDK